MAKLIQKTCRIRLARGTVIYCSNDVVREVRQYCMRAQNNVMLPLRGQRDKLVSELKRIATELPKHFPRPSHDILETFNGR